MENEDKISMILIWYATLSCRHKGQNFLKKSYRIGSSFHQKSIEVHRTENNVERRAKEVRFFCTLFAPVCRFVEQVEQVVGQGSLERICPDFGWRKKGGVWSKYLPEVTLPDTKNRIKIRKKRRAKKVRLFLRPVCPCVPLCETGGVVAGQGSLERICPDFGRRKKEVFGASICKGGLCQMRKMFAGEKPALNCRQCPSNPRSAEIFCQRWSKADGTGLWLWKQEMPRFP